MHSDRKDSYDGLMPVMIAAIVAVIGSAAVLVIDFGPAQGSQGNGGGMITAAAVSKAGATVFPTAPSDRPR
jgi:hypothetical protein